MKTLVIERNGKFTPIYWGRERIIKNLKRRMKVKCYIFDSLLTKGEFYESLI